MSSHVFLASLGAVITSFTLIIALLSLAALLLTLYVFYDIIFEQDRMQTAEKLIWLGIVMVLNLPGVVLYFLLVHSQDELIMGPAPAAEGTAAETDEDDAREDGEKGRSDDEPAEDGTEDSTDAGSDDGEKDAEAAVDGDGTEAKDDDGT